MIVFEWKNLSKVPSFWIYPPGSLTVRPLKIYHPKRKVNNTNYRFFRGELLNIGGVHVKFPLCSSIMAGKPTPP